MRNKISIICFLILLSLPLRAQLTEPVYSVPTADVASLGEFGEVPVSHFTGVPDVSVPLYSLKIGNFSWPIGVAYHLSSVRPNEQPGSTGLGWAPMWDACISRSVRGVPDEKKLSSGAEPGYYEAGVLQVAKVTDEDGRIAMEFRDMQGKTILMRSVVSDAGGSTVNMDTYYVYDAVGNLLAVLPPKASESISADVQTVPDDVLYGLCYQYRYDGQDRCTVKKLPGAASVFCVYDNADRIVLMQDGNNRQKGLSSFTLYDVLGRIVMTGTCTNGISINSDGTSSATGYVSGTIVKAVYGGSSAQIKGYDYTGITLSNPKPLAVTWYDTYDFISSVLGVSSSYVYAAPRYSVELTNTTGLITGSWSAVLGDPAMIPAQDAGLWSVTRYDLFGREARIVSCDNNGLIITDNEYSHRNSVLKSFITHVPNSGPVFTEEYNSAYDAEERLISQNHSFTGRPAVNTVTNTYDSIGRLNTISKGGCSLLNQTFTYNVRSWTTRIAGDLFTESLFYNDNLIGATSQWGGNISSLEWGMGSYGTAPTVGWDMTYDGLSRLTTVQGRREGVIHAGDSMSYTYDSMGNLLSKSISTAAGIESSTYNVPTTANTISSEIYDANGNQTTSTADGVAGIDYNILNLPQSVSLSDSTKVYYLYSASGAKLREVVIPGGTGETETTDYTGNLIYKNGTLHKVLTGSGYIESGDSTSALLSSPAYRYFLTDHLGSVRVVADAQGHVLQQNSMLPYGGDFETAEPGSYYCSYNPYKFSGKEQIRSGHYDFGARWYSPRSARWSTMDPLAEKYYSISPYAYCAGNPVRYYDPDGLVIRGITKQDIRIFREDIFKILADDKFANIRALIDIKGKTINKIDEGRLRSLMEGNWLTEDERAYITMITSAINSKDIHLVEYISGEYLSSKGSEAFVNHMNKTFGNNFGDKMRTRDGRISSEFVRCVGGGLDVPTEGGSHSFIIYDLNSSLRAVTSGHEVFGHGIPSAKELPELDNNANAVRTDNLIRRLLMLPQIEGRNHGGYENGYITKPYDLPILK